jgi:hypothetical protein
MSQPLIHIDISKKDPPVLRLVIRCKVSRSRPRSRYLGIPQPPKKAAAEERQVSSTVAKGVAGVNMESPASRLAVTLTPLGVSTLKIAGPKARLILGSPKSASGA